MRNAVRGVAFVGAGLLLAGAACGGDRASAPAAPSGIALPDTDALALNAIRVLALETYDGSGQTVHPDFLSLGAGAPPRSELLALTPYPFGNSAYENPVVYQSRNRLEWTVPVPSLNPVVSPQRGYLSDPDLVYDPVRREILMYYRQVDRENEILLMRSSGGATWTEPVPVVHAPNHEVISPAIVRRSASEWLMWSVNGRGGCAGTATTVEVRRSADGVEWSDPERASLDQPGFSPWHIEVQWIPNRREYWALYNAKTIESCSTPALYLATSADGVNWKTYPSPVLARGEIYELYDIVYRSTFAFDPASNVVTFWYSGARFDGGQYQWRTVTQRRRLGDVLEGIAKAPSHGMMALRAGVPPLMDPP